jgi:hypothetical protein
VIVFIHGKFMTFYFLTNCKKGQNCPDELAANPVVLVVLCLEGAKTKGSEEKITRNPCVYWLYFWWRIPDSNRGPADYDSLLSLFRENGQIA